jgi:hypothetical protein
MSTEEGSFGLTLNAVKRHLLESESSNDEGILQKKRIKILVTDTFQDSFTEDESSQDLLLDDVLFPIIESQIHGAISETFRHEDAWLLQFFLS